jgi:hypothetical protein
MGMQNFAPLKAELNGVECELISHGTGDVAGPPMDFGTPRAAAQEDQPVSLLDDKFIGVDGQPFNIRGAFPDLQAYALGLWSVGGGGTNTPSKLK